MAGWGARDVDEGTVHRRQRDHQLGVQPAAVERGWDLALLNRGVDSTRPPVEATESLVGDATDPRSLQAAIGSRTFDTVVNFRAFTPEQVRADIELFTGRTGQYVFISSASAYQKPVVRLPITESTPLRNPYWQYSRDKIACEDLLVAAYREQDFPATIVRPSHTYDPTLVPFDGGWTVIDRMRRGRPTVVHGDGTSFWTLTHSRDFAKAFVPLLADPRTLGDAVHITSDEHLTWDAVARGLASAAGATADIVHVGSARLARAIPELGGRDPGRQGPLVDLRQLQDQVARARLRGDHAPGRRAPARSSTGTTRTPTTRSWTPSSTPRSTGWCRRRPADRLTGVGSGCSPISRRLTTAEVVRPRKFSAVAPRCGTQAGRPAEPTLPR